MGRRRSTYQIWSDLPIISPDGIDRKTLNSCKMNARGSYRCRSDDRRVKKVNVIIFMLAYLDIEQCNPTVSCCWQAWFPILPCIFRSPSIGSSTCRVNGSSRNDKYEEGVQK